MAVDSRPLLFERFVERSLLLLYLVFLILTTTGTSFLVFAVIKGVLFGICLLFDLDSLSRDELSSIHSDSFTGDYLDVSGLYSGYKNYN